MQRTLPAIPDDLIDFGELPQAVNELLQQGVLAYRSSRAEAETRFLEALRAAPDALPVYFCLYKIHTYQGNLDAALAAARAGLREAARQAGWPEDFEAWPPPRGAQQNAERFALYTLKALAFIHLRRDEPAEANRALNRLELLDPQGSVGWHVVAALAQGLC